MNGRFDSAAERAVRRYGRLLALLPAPMRAEAAAEMTDVYREGWRQARAAGSWRARLRFWALTRWDLLLTAIGSRRGHTILPGPRPSFPDERGTMLDPLTRDARFALRSTLKKPGFAAIVIATLALAIGANTAIFSVVDGILFRPLPFPEADRLVAVWVDMTQRDGPVREWMGWDDIRDLRRQDVFAAIAGYSGAGLTLTGHGDMAESLAGATVSRAMFPEVLGIEPALGRSFTAEEDAPDGPRAVLLSDALWRRAFGADPSIVGEAITLNGMPYTVVGVMPARFRPTFNPTAAFWVPLQLDAESDAGDRGNLYIRTIARLAPGVGIEQARAALDTLAERREADYREYVGWDFAVFPLRDDVVDAAAQSLRILLGAVGFVLLMACVNIANLLLARGTMRSTELAVRAALGARRWQIVRQLLIETAVLTTAGGMLGALLGWLGTGALVSMAPPGTPRIEEVAVDARVLAFTGVVTVVCALIAGLVPALRIARTDVNEALKSGGRGGDAAAHGRLLRSGLVVAQVALAMVLLLGAGLLVRSFDALTNVDPGFDPRNVLAINLALPSSTYDTAEARIAFYERLEERLGALPGVESAGLTNALPLSGFDGDSTFYIEGRPLPEPGDQVAAWVRRITPGYFETLRIALIDGRGFTAADTGDASRVVVINETLARRFFPDQNPIGQRLTFGRPSEESTWREIVGIAHDVKNFGIDSDSRMAVYLPFAQAPTGFMFAALRTTGDPAELAGPVRGLVTELDPGLAVARVSTMGEMVSDSLAAQRFTTRLMSAFAVVALLLAAIGLYGVVSYGVGLRLHEMGIRAALGARPASIGRLVVGGSLGLILLGTVIGVVAAVAAGRLIAGLLFGVEATDPVTYVAAILVMAIAGLAAAAPSARRAARVDPVQVLNRE